MSPTRHGVRLGAAHLRCGSRAIGGQGQAQSNGPLPLHPRIVGVDDGEIGLDAAQRLLLDGDD
ncbi:MAG TPA: hypothetical protein VJ045_03915, partial [Hyphomicrobiaceae bacterium]|nr:hypothetical protein [Hyphomicrobiaceae bacterium]